ncbi:MAG TPA: hypothetical protein PKU93_00575 [Candidatus Pacearchaeota archaeon]|nr:hypothetical protein [Candidatus Pacearchaeota archaeon]
MDYKEAIEILLNLIKKYSLEGEEKDAIVMAIGTLDCGALAHNRFKSVMKSIKEKKNNS